MFGHAASSHTVVRFSSRTSSRVSEYSFEFGAFTLIQLGFFLIMLSGFPTFSGCLTLILGSCFLVTTPTIHSKPSSITFYCKQSFTLKYIENILGQTICELPCHKHRAQTHASFLITSGAEKRCLITQLLSSRVCVQLYSLESSQ